MEPARRRFSKQSRSRSMRGAARRASRCSRLPLRAQQMKVELEFELGRHAIAWCARATMRSSISTETMPRLRLTSSGVTERLQRLLGMSRDEFFRTYFTGQKELALMAAMAASERADSSQRSWLREAAAGPGHDQRAATHAQLPRSAACARACPIRMRSSGRCPRRGSEWARRVRRRRERIIATRSPAAR